MVHTTLTGYSILCTAIESLVRFGTIHCSGFNNVKRLRDIKYKSFKSEDRYNVPGTKVLEVYKASRKFIGSACFAATVWLHLPPTHC